MTEHTKGPWTMGLHLPETAQVYANDVLIAGVMARKDARRTVANARLIAAAPDLLEALKHIVEMAHKPGCVCAAHEAARAAIAKAEGRIPATGNEGEAK